MNSKNERQLKNINVYIRIRPPQTQFDKNSCLNTANGTQISIKSREEVEKTSFTFDGILNSEITQQQVYEEVAREIVDKSFEGINGTIFCYGQTASGKTYTCIGQDFNDQLKMGLLPRVIKEMLQKLKFRPKNIEANMKISMIQIYNEKIIDLLSEDKTQLKIRSSKSQGIFLAGVTEKYILELQAAFQLINKGISSRSVGSTQMNKKSSRSHLIFLINLYQHDLSTGEVKSAKFTLADLAGSEKLSRTGSEGKALEEAKKINTSLSTLGKVIHTLSENKKAIVPYRQSKLTRLLQESLGGNSITNLIINVSQEFENEFETLMSLRFGSRAKQIKNQPKVNKQYTVSELLLLLNQAEKRIKEQNQTINDLRRNSQFHQGDEISMIVKEESCSFQESKDISDKMNFYSQEDPYNFNQSTQSFEDFEEKPSLLKSWRSMKKIDQYLCLSPQLKKDSSLRRKHSQREFFFAQRNFQEQFSPKKIQIQQQVFSLTIESEPIVEQENQQKQQRINEKIKKIKMNLEMIKQKHLKMKVNKPL